MIDLQEIVRASLFGTPVKSVVRKTFCKHCYNAVPVSHVDFRGLCPECRRKKLGKCAACGDYVELDDLEVGICHLCRDAHKGDEFCYECHRWIIGGYDGEFCDECEECQREADTAEDYEDDIMYAAKCRMEQEMF